MRCLIRVQILSLPWPSLCWIYAVDVDLKILGLLKRYGRSDKVTSNSQNIPHK